MHKCLLLLLALALHLNAELLVLTHDFHSFTQADVGGDIDLILAHMTVLPERALLRGVKLP